MVTVYRKSSSIKDEQELELRGLSSDTKPTELNGKDIPNGTIFIEINTGKVYMYDAQNKEWGEI